MSFTPYRSAVIRALLDAARLGHLWTGRAMRSDAETVLADLRPLNARDATFLDAALAISRRDHPGPTVQEILKLDDPDRTVLRLALLAPDGPKQAQVWLAMVTALYGLDVDA